MTLTLKTKEVALLLGENGSGKSTLLKVLAGLYPYKGTISCTGNADHSDVTGYVFQNPETQIIGSTVWEDVIFGLENIGLKKEEIKKRAEWVLKVVGLYEFKDKDPFLLSGGQKQKLAIASILAMRPEFLLLDEPTAMLDKYDRTAVKELIKEIIRLQKGIIIATHHAEFFFDIAQRVIVLSRGKIIYDGFIENLPEKFINRF
ncbi:ABC transporter ATP-binding protein [Thermosipho ferrireducens]|uniref:ABC transporter ATP-binding protein n=1 Tax=Thermosipho ferrireducens TaxID=2571116 RepID=A0ABX7S8P3_9BACT|nr:ABC transporter ATP-binding protein [Thermosipho ferrireducens]